MKKKSTSQPVRRSLGKGGSAPARRNLGEGGFFNLRILLGLILALAGVCIALLGFGAFSNASAQANATQEPKAQQFGETTVIFRVAQRSVAAAPRTAVGVAASRDRT